MTTNQLDRARANLRSQHDLRIAAVRRAKEIAELAATGVAPTPDQEARYERAMADVDKYGKQMRETRDQIAEIEDNDAQSRSFGQAMDRAGLSDGSTRMKIASPEARYGRPLAADRSFTELDEKPQTVEDSGRYLAALVRGDDLALAEMRATMVTSNATAAGNLVPQELVSPLLDLARAKTRVLEAGARIVPMNSLTAKVPVHDGDPVATFRNEAAAYTESGVTVNSVTLTARSLGTLIRVSRELSQDSEIDMETYLADVVAQAFAIKMDQVALYGTGVAPEPEGLVTNAGVTKTNHVGANGGTLSNHDAVIDLVTALRSVNVDPSAVLLAPRTAGSIAKVREGAGTGQYLSMPGYVDVPLLTTTNIPVALTTGTSTDTSDIIAGRFSSLVIGIRQSLEVEVDRSRFRDTGEIALFADMRLDVKVARTGDFRVLRGVRP